MLRNVVSKREKDLPVSKIGELMRLSAESRDVVSLSIGEPDFPTLGNVVDFVKRCLDKGKYTHYSPAGGRKDLKEEIVKKLKKENKIRIGSDQVVVTNGSTEAILLGLMCVVDPTDGVLVPDPGYFGYLPSVEIISGNPVSVHLKKEDGFKLTTERLDHYLVPGKTKVLMLNYPSNPTGAVLTKKELEEIGDFAVDNNLIIFSDEAYEKFVYDGEFVSIGSLNGLEDRVVTFQSFSKSYAMAGWRVGYAGGPKKLIDAMARVHVETSLCAPTICQMGALEALKGSQKSVEKMKKEYDKRREFVCKRLKEMGIECVKPQGAFYFFPSIRQFGLNSLDFCEKLLKKERVALIPGSEFGKHGEGFVRISYSNSMENIRKGMDSLEKFVKKLH